MPPEAQCATLTHMNQVGVRELRQNLSRYVSQVKDGESFTVTERGREVAKLTPSGPADSPLSRLAAEHGATLPRADLTKLTSDLPPAKGPPSKQVLDELREERL